MKVVLDTNVLVSGLLCGSRPCGQLVGLALEGTLPFCVDERILAEYEAVLPRPKIGIDSREVTDVLEMIRTEAELVTAVPLAVALPHEDDRAFLEVAATSKAVLVTGNARHFPKKLRGEVPVVDCREVLELLAQSA